jgi:thioredoxin-like negative regulator of GroEL
VIPHQLHRSDFPRPDAPWLVAYFWSQTCDGCTTLGPKVAALESGAVATCALEAGADADLHRRYGISGVPLVVVADADGVVVRAFLGAFTATDLWAAVAEARDPGTGPGSGLGSLDRFA